MTAPTFFTGKKNHNLLSVLTECCPFVLKIFHYRADTIFIAKYSKGHNSVKNVGTVTVLFLCTSSDDGLYFYKVS